MSWTVITVSEPVLTVKIELRHEVRDAGKDISALEERLVKFVNDTDGNANAAAIELHPDLSAELVNLDSGVTDTRISVGHRASGLYLELKGNKRFNNRDIDRVVHSVIQCLDHTYADGVEARGWTVQATEKGRYV